MQEHRHQEPLPVHFPVSASELTLNPPADLETNTQVDAYLDAIGATMPAEVPAEAVQNMLREMRGHLQSAIAANRELGHVEAEAVAHSLAQFGKPETVARQWRQEWEQTLTATTKAPLRASLKLALKAWSAASAAAFVACLFISGLVYSDPYGLRMPLIMGVIVGIPLLTGAVIGLRARRHPVLCTLAGCALLSPLMVLGLMGVNHWAHYYALLRTGKTHLAFTPDFTAALSGVQACLPTWIILSLFSSGVIAIGRHIRTRTRRQIAH